MKLLSIITLTSLLIGCTHSLHVAHVSDFSPSFKSYSQGELVRARQEQFTVMGFVTETNFVDQAYRRLEQQCPKGQIQGITSQFSTSHAFFSWTNVLELQGLCIN
jgi:hypothetical protein